MLTTSQKLLLTDRDFNTSWDGGYAANENYPSPPPSVYYYRPY